MDALTSADEIKGLIVLVGMTLGALTIKATKDTLIAWWTSLIKRLLHRPKHFMTPGIAIQGHELHSKLLVLQTILRADRCYLLQFHNGSNFSSRQPMWRLSCTHESCRPGVSYISPLMQNVMASNLWEALGSVYGLSEAPGISRIPPDVERTCSCEPPKGAVKYDMEEMVESQVKSTLRSFGVQHMLYTGLFDAGHNLIGIIGADYLAEYRAPGGAGCILCEASGDIALELAKN
jgi:hypothetical protein